MASGDKYMLEPATGRYREVQAASGGAGTGINGGDYEYTTPAKYKYPVSRSGLSYRFDTATADADPGTGLIRFDNVTPGSVTGIYIDDLDDELGADWSPVFSQLAAGDRILVAQINDRGRFLLASVASAPTDNGGYFDITVTVDDSGSLPQSNEGVSVTILPKQGGGGGSDHGALTGLGDDDHSQYALLAGRSVGQHLNGGTAAAEALILQGTTHGDGGPVKIENGILLFNSPDVASSTTIDIQAEGNIPWITGTTTIQTISNGTRGAILHLFFASSGCRVKGDGTGNILLPESLDYISQANEVLSLIHDNSYWRALGPLPAAGKIEMSAVDDMPGVLECDGSAVSRTTYARLFDAIGTTWGTGDGSTTFNLPDLRDQFMKGIASSGESIGDTGGSKNITPAGTLSSDATGVTNNGVATIGAAGGAARAGAGAVPAVAGDPVTPDTINDPMHTHSFTGTQHSNEPQHTVLRYFIRY